MAQPVYDKQTIEQMDVLKKISAISKKTGIAFWLRGGWAIDFLLGEITRPHNVIDLITWIQHREVLERELLKDRFKNIPVKAKFKNRQSDFSKNNVDITFGYITRSSDGLIMMNGLSEWIWRSDSLLTTPFILHGSSACVLHPRQQLEEKEAYEQIGRKPRQKDVESKRLLRRIIDDSFC
ncbi:hypothetical protein C4B60_15895 [Jeotgalibacillus proteolyticus]|uniref:Aminoglycoside adenylyltransferase n=1 Tax=Jeotgalibacillus proteolyticus TaxID=2082395 RepID=A0A2S5G8M7_9BACL|nr:hypothetical protein C4B60_15895 [Jeotgalibacillus proteolyticus]